MLPFEMKSFDAAKGTFEGFASTPQLDRMREVVSTEAMREASERYMRNPIITDHHGGAIGRGLGVEVTEAGTILRGYITDKTQQGRDVRGLMEDNILRSLSIGFNPYSRSYGPHPDGTADYELVPPSEKPAPTTGYGYGPWYSENEDTLVWKRIDWMETAICAIPCNPGATLTLAKSMGLTMDAIKATPAKPREQSEEGRFLDDLERVRTGMESVQNITRHWHKQGRILTAEHRATLMQAQATLTGLLEPYPVVAEEPAPQGALSLPDMDALALPGD
jgi:hypothetical protein